MILDGFTQSADKEEEYVQHLNAWRDAWNSVDAQATGVLPASYVLKLVAQMERPIGVGLEDSRDDDEKRADKAHVLYHLWHKLPLTVFELDVYVSAKMGGTKKER